MELSKKDIIDMVERCTFTAVKVIKLMVEENGDSSTPMIATLSIILANLEDQHEGCIDDVVKVAHSMRGITAMASGRAMMN